MKITILITLLACVAFAASQSFGGGACKRNDCTRINVECDTPCKDGFKRRTDACGCNPTCDCIEDIIKTDPCPPPTPCAQPEEGCHYESTTDSNGCENPCGKYICPDTPAPCADGSDPVLCIIAPCDVSKCDAVPGALCENDYCGGCNAVWTLDGKQVSCDLGNSVCEDGEQKKSDDGCNDCTCVEGQWSCTKRACICQEGEQKKSDDGCNDCFCQDNAWACTERACTCEQGATKPADDGCNTCTCVNNVWACTKKACIDTCEEGTTKDADDGCNTCTCVNNVWACTKKACVDVCEEGATKQADDGCNTCSCVNGLWACTKKACVDTCPQLDCPQCASGNKIDPVTNCPTCECEKEPCTTAIKCSNQCPNGYVLDKNGCQTSCECKPTTDCEPVTCRLFCEHGWAKDPRTNCDICACADGETNACDAPVCFASKCAKWKYTADGCQTCECDDETKECPLVCANYCPYGRVVDENNCPTCTCKGSHTCPDVKCDFFANQVCKEFKKDAMGCATCECADDTKQCPPLCRMYCEYGNVVDSNGCEICECKPKPKCADDLCKRLCPNGFKKGKDGCQLCECNEADETTCKGVECPQFKCMSPPKGCTADFLSEYGNGRCCRGCAYTCPCEADAAFHVSSEDVCERCTCTAEFGTVCERLEKCARLTTEFDVTIKDASKLTDAELKDAIEKAIGTEFNAEIKRDGDSDTVKVTVTTADEDAKIDGDAFNKKAMAELSKLGTATITSSNVEDSAGNITNVESGGGLSDGLIAAIVIGALALVAVLAVAMWCVVSSGRHQQTARSVSRGVSRSASRRVVSNRRSRAATGTPMN